ncbi:hypothetical protein [Mycolicibacterium farcinogenes]|uniref:Uncharacterized protein n=1 Tax=Mycolicibacterium farcinogenes TaxID=1802 RepID=A0ACD1FMQ5_MYCFR|nr:hypothetical protein [Mycolicibacterium farcinogenes]QZH68326.1 hypothetical protein K6L26_12270 [Mycolicibacterium farcinogenes]
MTTDWTDYRGELDPDQQAEMVRLDAHGDYERKAEQLVAHARDFVKENLLQTWLADVPVPAGAVTVGRWIDDGVSIYRFCDGTARGDVRIVIQQYDSGRVERYVFAGNDDQRTAAQARERGENLVAAAEEIERYQ